MAILNKGEIDLAALRKARQAKASKTDLVAGLRQVSPEIELLKNNQTASIEGVKPADIRKVVMSITAKLSHLTARGGAWAGRKYEVASDADAGIVYVQRQTGVKPEDAPIRRTGGGRKPKSETPAPAPTGEAQDPESEATGDTVTSGDGVSVVEHA